VNRTCLHHDPRNWRDTLAGDVVLTTCEVCKGFIGYRPKDPPKGSAQAQAGGPFSHQPRKVKPSWQPS
jgi:hypothetical protein